MDRVHLLNYSSVNFSCSSSNAYIGGGGGGMLFADMSVRSLQRQDSVREELKESFHMESGVSTPKTSIVAGLCNR